MNYKEAMQAWLDNPEVKLEWYSDSIEEWVPFRADTNTYAPLFVTHAKYRVKKLKARAAIFNQHKVVITEDKYEEMLSLPFFEKWISDEFEIYT